MTISKDLLLSILAMDSYNQGYGQGVNHGKSKIGSATLDLQSDVSTNGDAYGAGFYAASYNVDASGLSDESEDFKVISYRGTDNIAQETVAL